MVISAKENMLRVIRHDNPAWVPNGLGEAVYTLPCPLDERPENAGPDVFGVLWDLKEDAEGGTYPAHNGHTITDIDLWREQLTLPNLDAIDWNSIKKLSDSIDREKYLVQGFVHMGLFERSYLLFGMENALVYFLTETDEMNELLHVIADYKIDLINRIYETCHPDMMAYGDDWGTQDNLFLPPEIWRKTIGKETSRVYKRMKELGLLINQHSCGKIDAVFGDMVEMGADLINPCQPCNDLAGLKRRYGDRICFVGGIDSQHVLGKPGVTAEEIDAEVKKRITEMGYNGGYVATPSHFLPFPKYVLEAMNNAIAKYGQYYNG